MAQSLIKIKQIDALQLSGFITGVNNDIYVPESSLAQISGYFNTVNLGFSNEYLITGTNQNDTFIQPTVIFNSYLIGLGSSGSGSALSGRFYVKDSGNATTTITGFTVSAGQLFKEGSFEFTVTGKNRVGYDLSGTNGFLSGASDLSLSLIGYLQYPNNVPFANGTTYVTGISGNVVTALNTLTGQLTLLPSGNTSIFNVGQNIIIGTTGTISQNQYDYTNNSAATIIVDQTYGSDISGQRGTKNPFYSLSGAIAVAQSGDYVLVRGNQNVSGKINLGVNNLTIDGQNANINLLDPDNPYLFIVSGTGIEIKNLSVNGNRTTQSGISSFPNYTVWVIGDNFTLDSCEFNNFRSPVVIVYGGRPTASGTISAQKPIIRNNTFNNCFRSIILQSIGGSISGVNDFRVESNRIFNCFDLNLNEDSLVGGGRAIGIGRDDTAAENYRGIISNNHIYNGGQTSIELYNKSKYITVADNFVYGGAIGISLGGGDQCSVVGNVVQGTKSYCCEVSLSNYATICGNIFDCINVSGQSMGCSVNMSRAATGIVISDNIMMNNPALSIFNNGILTNCVIDSNQIFSYPALFNTGSVALPIITMQGQQNNIRISNNLINSITTGTGYIPNNFIRFIGNDSNNICIYDNIFSGIVSGHGILLSPLSGSGYNFELSRNNTNYASVYTGFLMLQTGNNTFNIVKSDNISLDYSDLSRTIPNDNLLTGNWTTNTFPTLSGHLINYGYISGRTGINSEILTGLFYPLNSNPSGYVTTGQTGQFVSISSTGSFATTSYILDSGRPYNKQTISFYPNYGSVTGILNDYWLVDNIVLTGIKIGCTTAASGTLYYSSGSSGTPITNPYTADIYLISTGNVQQSQLRFTFPTGVTYSGSGVNNVILSGNSRVGVNVISGSSGCNGLNIGLFGYLQ